MPNMVDAAATVGDLADGGGGGAAAGDVAVGGDVDVDGDVDVGDFGDSGDVGLGLLFIVVSRTLLSTSMMRPYQVLCSVIDLRVGSRG